MALSADIKPNLSQVTIAIVVGEESGDILGAGLMKSLTELYPNARFEGIGGPRMLALGFHSLFPQDRLAVMGFVEPLKRLPELLQIRRSLRDHFINNRPEIFIGIDAPDFNLGLERKLRAAGIKTVHYVSPSVWAWRQGRVKTIAESVDLMLTLLPFEKKFYDKHGVPAEFVGHPLADEIELETPHLPARDALGLNDDSGRKVVALMPGSRANEVARLAPLFLQTARCIMARKKNTVFVLPAANAARLEELQSLLLDYPDIPVKLLAGQSHLAMAAADVVLMASGTTSLEALLLKRPMVIAYRIAWLSYWIMKRLAKIKYIGLPNLLHKTPLAPEFLQNRAQPDVLCDTVIALLDDEQVKSKLNAEFMKVHIELRRDASATAAKHIYKLLETGGSRC